MATNVRIQSATYAQLRELARQSKASMPEVLAEAIDDLYRKRFLEDCNRAYARIKADPKAWKEELEERAVWDTTVGDGLEDA
jgi:hypothetical protein